jgi:CDP-diacylglycerol---glycerol-3-phosphate 3-phosphatidyltransferase
MFPRAFNERVRRFTSELMRRTLARTGITASELTVLSPLLTLGAVWLLATGNFVAGGLMVAFASSFDMLDGALARAKNEVSLFGSFLDSTLDRYSDVLIFLGLLLHYQWTAPGSNEIILIYAATTGSVLISYVRAKAEALGYDCKVGLLERPERIVLIILGLLTGWVTLVLWVLAIFTHVTAAQRFVHVWRQSRAARAEAEQPALKAEKPPKKKVEKRSRSAVS